MSKPMVGHDGLRLVTRWYPTSKRALILSVEAGHCDLDQALQRYGLTRAEFDRWVELYREEGLKGLQTSRRHAGGLAAELPAPVAKALPLHGRRPRGRVRPQ